MLHSSRLHFSIHVLGIHSEPDIFIGVAFTKMITFSKFVTKLSNF